MKATSLLAVRKERQTKVALEPGERSGRRPIIIREENRSRADSRVDVICLKKNEMLGFML